MAFRLLPLLASLLFSGWAHAGVTHECLPPLTNSYRMTEGLKQTLELAEDDEKILLFLIIKEGHKIPRGFKKFAYLDAPVPEGVKKQIAIRGTKRELMPLLERRLPEVEWAGNTVGRQAAGIDLGILREERDKLVRMPREVPGILSVEIGTLGNNEQGIRFNVDTIEGSEKFAPLVRRLRNRGVPAEIVELPAGTPAYFKLDQRLLKLFEFNKQSKIRKNVVIELFEDLEGEASYWMQAKLGKKPEPSAAPDLFTVAALTPQEIALLSRQTFVRKLAMGNSSPIQKPNTMKLHHTLVDRLDSYTVNSDETFNVLVGLAFVHDSRNVAKRDVLERFGKKLSIIPGEGRPIGKIRGLSMDQLSELSHLPFVEFISPDGSQGQ